MTTDAEWSASNPEAHSTTRHYDADSNLDASTDGNGKTTAFAFDPAGQLVAVNRPDGTTLQNAYWPDGKLKSQTDGAGRSTNFAYDPLGRLTTVTDPLGRVTKYGYDRAGNLVSRQDPNGNCSAAPNTGCTTFGYDPADQLTSITYSDGVTPNVTNVQYDAVGRRTAMTDGTGTSTWAWDSLGRMTQSVHGTGAALGYGYNLRDQVTTVTYPGTVGAVNRGFDGLGRMDRVTDWAGRTTSFAYDADSNMVSTSYPNGTSEAASFDGTNAHTASTLTGPSGPLASLAYGRDGAGQLSALSGSGLGQPTEAYGYTDLEQLRSVNGVPVFDYDTADNLTRLRGATQAFDLANQLTSSTPDGGSATSFGYDSRGNRTSMTGPGEVSVGYGWDQSRRMTSAGSSGAQASYSYDGDGLRMSKVVGGVATAFVWDVSGALPLAVKDGANWIVYGPGGLPLEQVAPDGTTHWFFDDQLGSTRGLTDSAGVLVATRSYDPYGQVVASSGTAATHFGFTGGYTDDETGFVFLRARYYDPATGQFLSRDPLVGTTRSAYGYVGGSPLNATDPSGMDGSGVAGTAASNDPWIASYMEKLFDLYNKNHREAVTLAAGRIQEMMPGAHMWVDTYRSSNGLRPDLVVLYNGQYYFWEVKPNTPYGVRTGNAQLAAYDACMIEVGGIRGPSLGNWQGQMSTTGGVYVHDSGTPGLIYYEKDQRELRKEALKHANKTVPSLAVPIVVVPVPVPMPMPG